MTPLFSQQTVNGIRVGTIISHRAHALQAGATKMKRFTTEFYLSGLPLAILSYFQLRRFLIRKNH
jgi:hypothetical protein